MSTDPTTTDAHPTAPGTDVAVPAPAVPQAIAASGLWKMAEQLAQSTLLPAALRRQPANVFLVLLGAQALGIAPFTALQEMYVVDGRLSMSATLMRSRIRAAGHRLRVVTRTTETAVVSIHRCDEPEPYLVEYTWQEAVMAKLSTKDNWVKYPKAMLVARATSIAAREECPEVLHGLSYLPDELGAVTDAEGRPVLDGEVVTTTPSLTHDQAVALRDRLLEAPLAELPTMWATIVGHDARAHEVPGQTAWPLTLADWMALRLCTEADAMDTTDEVMAVWQVATDLGFRRYARGTGYPMHLDTGTTTVPDYIRAAGQRLKDKANGGGARFDPDHTPSADVPVMEGVIVDDDPTTQGPAMHPGGTVPPGEGEEPTA